MKKPPPFQNLDRLQPRKFKRTVANHAPTGSAQFPDTHITASDPTGPVNHIAGSVGCYRTPRSEGGDG